MLSFPRGVWSIVRHISSSKGRSLRFEIWNSLEKQTVEVSSSRVPNLFTWYSCGPTVYDSSHIGHASSYIRQDVIRRLLEGIDGRNSVLQLMGVTDIDDKIIAKANQSGVPWETISRKYEAEFFEDLLSLNVKPPQIRTRVTEFIPQIVEFVKVLVEKGLAYPTEDGSVYFDTQKYERYGKLRKLSELQSSEGVEEGQGKRNRQDFAVWKGWKTGEPFWVTPWGKGRPGWHIECSVMASHFFGRSLDIHSGGVDLLFPHHENEEAQCCARFDVQDWVTHWIHTGHLSLRGDVKMSKSLGNTLTIQDFLKDNSAETLRMFCILTKYRHGLEYSPDAIHHANSLLVKLEAFVSDTHAILRGVKDVTQTENLWNDFMAAKDRVLSSLTCDFDTPSAVHAISEYIDKYHRTVRVGTGSGPVDLGLTLASGELVRNFLSLVGLSIEKTEASAEKVNTLLEELTKFRRNVRNFALASEEGDKSVRKQRIAERKPLLDACDEVRESLGNVGIDLQDHGKESSFFVKTARK